MRECKNTKIERLVLVIATTIPINRIETGETLEKVIDRIITTITTEDNTNEMTTTSIDPIVLTNMTIGCKTGSQGATRGQGLQGVTLDQITGVAARIIITTTIEGRDIIRIDQSSKIGNTVDLDLEKNKVAYRRKKNDDLH